MPGALSKKQILADPVNAYRQGKTTFDETVLSKLGSLGDQHLALKQQRNALQEQTRQLSRKIGEAKRGNQPTDPLKEAMKEQSGLLKALESKLSDTEKRILDEFGLITQPGKKSRSPTQQAPLIRERNYQSTPVDYTIRLDTDNLDATAWNRYVAANPAASIYHRAEWLTLIDRTFGHQGYYFSARDESGQVVGILPLVRLKSRLFGDFMVSMPYFNYGGAIGESRAIESALMAAANSQAAELGVAHIEYRDDIPRDNMPVRHDKVEMVLRLPATAEALWAQFGSKLRSQIKRAQRESPVVEIGGHERVDDFYRVFSRNMRDLGTPVYGKSLFSNIIDTFPEESRIVVIKIGGLPVAGGFLLAHENRLEIPWASTVRDFNHLSVNMILYWEVLKHAIDKGFKEFDFGRSSRDASTYRFKQQWGAQPEQLHWHYHLIKGQEIPAITTSNAKYALMINMWKKLPIMLTRWLGPMIVRNIP